MEPPPATPSSSSNPVSTGGSSGSSSSSVDLNSTSSSSSSGGKQRSRQTNTQGHYVFLAGAMSGIAGGWLRVLRYKKQCVGLGKYRIQCISIDPEAATAAAAHVWKCRWVAQGSEV